MNLEKDIQKEEIDEVIEVADEFASGTETGLNRWFSKLGEWIFSKPHIPPSLLGGFIFVVVYNLIIVLVQQPAEYWIDPQYSWGPWPLVDLLPLGPLLFTGITIGYVLIICFILLMPNRYLALFLWALFCLAHLELIPDWGECGIRPFFFSNDETICHSFKGGFLTISAIVLGILFVSAAIQSDFIPVPHPKKSRKLSKIILAGLGASWLLFLLSGIIVTLTSPRPEWKIIETSRSPQARAWSTLAYDPNNKRALLFGGTTPTADGPWIELNDTWEWNGNDWVLKTPDTSPSPRLCASMAYDKRNNAMVLFGGKQEEDYLNDTWLWTGEEWQPQNPANMPGARCNAGMFYDPIKEKIVLIGGYTNKVCAEDFCPSETEIEFLKDVWEWDGKDWKEINIGDSRASGVLSIVYDPSRRLPVSMDYDGVWYWEGNQWKKPYQEMEPPSRSQGALTYNPFHDHILLFGGYEGDLKFGDTWLLKGNTWKEIVTRSAPTARTGHVMFFDTERKNAVLFGGRTTDGVSNETWELVIP